MNTSIEKCAKIYEYALSFYEYRQSLIGRCNFFNGVRFAGFEAYNSRLARQFLEVFLVHFQWLE